MAGAAQADRAGREAGRSFGIPPDPPGSASSPRSMPWHSPSAWRSAPHRFASNGGLVYYGPDLHELFRLAAGYVDPGPGPTAPTRSRKRLRKAPGTEGWIIWSEFEWDHSSAADQPDVSVINRQRQVPA